MIRTGLTIVAVCALVPAVLWVILVGYRTGRVGPRLAPLAAVFLFASLPWVLLVLGLLGGDVPPFGIAIASLALGFGAAAGWTLGLRLRTGRGH